jgi:hypothetical protein
MTTDSPPDFLARAQAIRNKVCAETHAWVRLDVLEGLIAEIEMNRARPRSPADIVKKLEGKS